MNNGIAISNGIADPSARHRPQRRRPCYRRGAHSCISQHENQGMLRLLHV